MSEVWLVAQSGKSTVRHIESTKYEGYEWARGRLFTVCSAVGKAWRPATDHESSLRECAICRRVEQRDFFREITLELRGAENRMKFAEKLRNLARDRGGLFLYVGDIPDRFLDAEQAAEFADALDQARRWLQAAAHALDPQEVSA